MLAYLLTDEAYAVVITRDNQPGDASRSNWYYLGAGLTLVVLAGLHRSGHLPVGLASPKTGR